MYTFIVTSKTIRVFLIDNDNANVRKSRYIPSVDIV